MLVMLDVGVVDDGGVACGVVDVGDVVAVDVSVVVVACGGVGVGVGVWCLRC